MEREEARCQVLPCFWANVTFTEIGRILPSLIERDKGMFLVYSTSSKAYWVDNMKIETVIESINVVVDDEPFVHYVREIRP
jgi:hypothetical protein